MKAMTTAIVALLVAACSPGYDFRSDDRPAYARAVTVDEVPTLRKNGAVLLDVRLLEDFNDDPQLIPDAMYRDPDDIAAWAGAMTPTDKPVVVYCVRGKWVSQKAANYLSERGFDVYKLDGGIEAWKSAGLETRPAASL